MGKEKERQRSSWYAEGDHRTREEGTIGTHDVGEVAKKHCVK